MEFKIDLVVERSIVRESIKGILWTIFFTRLFGPVTPMEQEFLDISYPMASNLPELDSLIDDKISKFIKYVDKTYNPIQSENNKKHTINVEFYNTRDQNSTNNKRKSTGWFGGKQQFDDESSNIDRSNIWENWFINVEILPINNNITKKSMPQPINKSTYKVSPNIEATMKSFESNLLRIYDIVDQHKDHIPPITSLDSAPFHYEIKINDTGDFEGKGTPKSSDNNDDEGWGTYIKKILD